jgi:uncharacterized protein (DUF4415 family)
MRKLTEVQKRDIKAVAAKRDEDIDLSDAPPIPDWNGAESASSTGQKRSPNDALDSEVIDWLKADGRGNRNFSQNCLCTLCKRDLAPRNGQKLCHAGQGGTRFAPRLRLRVAQ